MPSDVYRRASQMVHTAKGPKWKRELVSDHKFDFIDIEEFRDQSCILTIRYIMLFCSVLISTMVYGADLWTAAILLIYDHWSLSTQPMIPFHISKWIYVGCIVISFMLLAWEIRKTRSIMETRDISLAVTNPLAYRTYSVKSYAHFCLLQKIKNSTKWSDVIIFYVFYTLKSWKRVIIAQGPRQIIAGITVYALLKSAWTGPDGKFKFSDDWDTYGQDWPQRVALFLMSFTCILWILSVLQITLSVLLYFPILCQIQGNLKEYCCHKIDKRINELLEKQRKKRIREREKYNHSISSKKSKKSIKSGNYGSNGDELQIIPAVPTLPVINDVDLYASEKKQSNPWLYQHAEQQNSFYYDSQPMTPLESSYSLHRDPTNKYSPYSETPYMNTSNIVYQPAKAYIHQNNNTIATPTTMGSNSYYSAYSTPSSHQQGAYKNLHTYDSTPTALKSEPPHAYDDSQSTYYNPTTPNTNITTTITGSYHPNNNEAQFSNANHYNPTDENISMISGPTSKERLQLSNIQNYSYHHEVIGNNDDPNAGTRNGSNSTEITLQFTGSSKQRNYTYI